MASASTVKIRPIPAVNGIVFNEKRQILLTQRARAIREPLKWCLPGGHIEIGERWEEALIREMKEETGLTIRAFELCGIYSDPALTVAPEIFSDGKKHQFVAASFLVTNWEGELAANDEVEAFGWFELGNLPTPFLKSHPQRIEDAFAFRGKVYVR